MARRMLLDFCNAPRYREWALAEDLQITPSPTLEFHPCFGSWLCAKLSVPVDWNETVKDAGPRASIAILKKPAKVDVTDPRYGGPILFNPGEFSHLDICLLV